MAASSHRSRTRREEVPAPDLGAAPKADADRQPSGPNGQKPNGHAFADGRPAPGAARGRKPFARPAKAVLAADQSAALRERLVAELDGLGSAERHQLGVSEPARQEHADGC